MYPEEIVIPMKEELTENGFTELLTSTDVESKIINEGTTLVVINSVCGCSARVGRPGAILSLLNKVVPDSLVTIFAGMEKEAV